VGKVGDVHHPKNQRKTGRQQGQDAAAHDGVDDLGGTRFNGDGHSEQKREAEYDDSGQIAAQADGQPIPK
jgi:hypothetical protein